jgi:hypothetical protein
VNLILHGRDADRLEATADDIRAVHGVYHPLLCRSGARILDVASIGQHQ